MTIEILQADGAPDASAPGQSAVSWPAIFAGAATAAAATLILLALGSGIGFAASSPWANAGAMALKVSIGAAIWLIFTQWIASGVGGYIAGRLRTRWTGVHTHEVFFRDTAHGFLAWAISTVFTAAVLSSAALSTVGTGAHVAASAGDPLAYDVDYLFRTPRTADAPSLADARMQAGRILEQGLKSGALSDEDATYLAQLVTTQTGMATPDAQQRVETVMMREHAAVVTARQAVDSARKTAEGFSIFTALAMLVGAFIASVAAALGGQERDQHP